MDTHRSAAPKDLAQTRVLDRDDLARSLQLDYQDRFAARRIFRLDGGPGRLQRQSIHDLDCAREQTTGDDRRNGVAGGFERAVPSQHRVKALRTLKELQGNFQSDAEQTFVAGE